MRGWKRAHVSKAVVERDVAAKKLDDVAFPNNVQPPPMATQLQNLGGVSAIVVGAFCEHNDQVHSLMNLLAAKAGPGAEADTGLDNKSAVAFEKHEAPHPHPAADGGGGMARLPRIYSRAPALRPLLHRRRRCLSKRTCGARADERQEPRARGAQPRPVPRLRCARGGRGRAPPRTMREPTGEDGAAQQRRCPVKYKPPPSRSQG
jgi:hypothetical protein